MQSREDFDELKDEVAKLSGILSEIGDHTVFASQTPQAIEACTCARRIHEMLTSADGRRYRIQGGPSTPGDG